MSKSNALETALLAFVFNASTPLWDGAADLYASLHTSDPGEGGDQSSNEATYSGYERVAIPRDSGGWTVTDGSVTNAAQIQFPVSGGPSNTVTHIGIGTALSGPGTLFYRALLQTQHSFGAGGQPTISPGAIVITED